MATIAHLQQSYPLTAKQFCTDEALTAIGEQIVKHLCWYGDDGLFEEDYESLHIAVRQKIDGFEDVGGSDEYGNEERVFIETHIEYYIEVTDEDGARYPEIEGILQKKTA